MVIPGGGAVMTFAGAAVCASAGATKLAATKAAAASETLFIVTSVLTAAPYGAALEKEHSRTFVRCALANFYAASGRECGCSGHRHQTRTTGSQPQPIAPCSYMAGQLRCHRLPHPAARRWGEGA